MAETTGLKESAASESSVATSSRQDATESAEISHQQSDTDASGLKTIQVLKEWPIITATVTALKQYYESLKTSSRVFNWSCTLTEKSMHAVRERSTNVLLVFYPAIRIADLAASELAERLQKKLPVARQPPSQVYDAVKSPFSDLLAPLVEKSECLVNNGKRRTRNVAKRVVEMYRKLVHSLDDWMEKAEKYIEASDSKGIQVPQVQEPVAEPLQLNARSLAKRSLEAATNAGLFSVGASVWLLSRLPIVGRLLDLTPSSSPASSTSASPVRQADLRSSRSSSESRPSAGTAEPLER